MIAWGLYENHPGEHSWTLIDLSSLDILRQSFTVLKMIELNNKRRWQGQPDPSL